MIKERYVILSVEDVTSHNKSTCSLEGYVNHNIFLQNSGGARWAHDKQIVLLSLLPVQHTSKTVGGI